MGLFKKKKVEETKIEETSESFIEKDLLKEDEPITEIHDLSENANQYVSLRNINKIYDNGAHAVVDFNLDVKQREFVVFVGPSGCGKSTTLRMIAGLEEISAGELYIDGIYSNDLSPKDRDIAMVFQSYSLYPNMTVFDNLAFSLKVRKFPYPVFDENGQPVMEFDDEEIARLEAKLEALKEIEEPNEQTKEEINNLTDKINHLKETPTRQKVIYKKMSDEEVKERVNEAAKILEIEDYLQRKPSQLSGGQRQRVALGRAIVRKAKIFLMDEPLSNLDAKLRVQMRSEIIKLHKRVKATTIYVTHDQTEAMTMADRIVVMKLGYVQQIGTPLEIYRHPANQFVASFLGSPAMNFIEATYSNGQILFKDGHVIQLSKEEIKKHDDYYLNEEQRVEEMLPRFHDFLVNRYEENQNKRGLFKKKQDFLLPEEDPDYLKLTEHLGKIKEIREGNDHPIMFGIRPEDIEEVQKGDKDSFEAEISLSELLGKQYYVHVPYGGEEIVSIVYSEIQIEAGSKINLRLKQEKMHLFDYLNGKTIF